MREDKVGLFIETPSNGTFLLTTVYMSELTEWARFTPQSNLIFSLKVTKNLQ